MKVSQLVDIQPEVVRILQNSKKKNKLVHAYIFEGEDGTGINEAALYFACMVLCDKEVPCLECQTCTRVLQKEHTNLYFIEPINGVIKKEQITDVIKEFSMSGLENGGMIYIINDADKMNMASSNALLKFLEEPGPNRYAILLVNNHSKLLDTIVSRCQIIHFKPLQKDLMIEKYQKLGVNEDTAYILANLTSDIDHAKHMIEEENILDLIELARKVNEDRNKKRNPFINFNTKNINLRQKLNKDNNEIFLSILMLICEERIKYLNNSSNYYFSNLVNRTPHKKESINTAIRELEIYCKYQERMRNNVNVDLQYASMFIELEKEVY